MNAKVSLKLETNRACNGNFFGKNSGLKRTAMMMRQGIMLNRVVQQRLALAIQYWVGCVRPTPPPGGRYVATESDKWRERASGQ